MRRAITEKIAKAIESYARERGMSSEDIGVVVGVSKSAVHQWRKREVDSIRSDHWAKLEPIIRPYLDKEPPAAEAREDPWLDALMPLWRRMSNDQRATVVGYCACLLAERRGVGNSA